jgi:hypothetical protein
MDGTILVVVSRRLSGGPLRIRIPANGLLKAVIVGDGPRG